MPRKTFVDGTDAIASDVNTYLMDQAVQTYADATARDAALTSPTEGQLVYLADINQVQAYLGSTWYPIAGQMPLYDATKVAQSVSNGSTVTATWATATTNRGGFTVASNVVTVPYTGLYSINSVIPWAGSATGYRLNRILINGSSLKSDINTIGVNVSFSHTNNISHLTLTAGDTISVEIYQNSGGSLNALANGRLIIGYLGA